MHIKIESESGDLNRDLLSDTPRGMLVLSPRLDIMSCNHTLQNILRRTLVPSDHCPLEQIFSASDLKQAEKIMESVLKKGEQFMGINSSLTSKTGMQIRCSYSAEPLFDEAQQIIGAIFSFRVEKSLSTSPVMSKYNPQINYQALFEKLPEGVFTVNTGWRITSFNRTAEEFT